MTAIDSTNAWAFDEGRDGDPGRLWVTADYQTTGRGRRGRAWVSERGNLYASVLLIEPCPPQRLGDLPMVCCVALADAVEAATGRIGLVSLKWPNDLLIDGAKLSGILLESERLTSGRLAVVCGFGVNCAHHPEASAYRTTDLAVLGYRVTPDMLFGKLAEAFDRRLREWRAGAGFASIRAAWLQRCVGIGGPVTVRLPTRTIEGTFEGLDADGHLLLGRADGTMKISAGDVFFPGDATRNEDPI